MTILQKPNLPLSVALLAALLNLIIKGPAHAFVTAVFYMNLTIWAYLEAIKGDSWFRRLLGLAFLAYVLIRLGSSLPHV